MEIELGSLLSRTKASLVRPGGVKQMLGGFGKSIQAAGGSGSGGILGWIWGAIKNVGGWLISHLWSWLTGFISWSFTTIVQWIQQTTQFVWNFDWNKSDSALDDAISAQYMGLLTQAGSTLGASLGWLVCGLAPGAIMFVFNEPLGVYILNHVGEEALEELIPQIGALVRSTLRTVTRHALIATYKRLRKKLVGANEYAPRTDADIEKQYNDQVTAGTITQNQAKDSIEKAKRIRDAAKGGFERKPYSFAKRFEDWKEANIPQKLQDFAEELVEEFSDSCFEAMYCVAGGLDSYVAMQRVTRAAVLGNQTGVRITFNRNTTPTPTPNP